MELYTVRCINCGDEKTCKHGSIGEIMKETEFEVIFGIEENLNWMCQECFEKAMTLSK